MDLCFNTFVDTNAKTKTFPRRGFAPDIEDKERLFFPFEIGISSATFLVSGYAAQGMDS